jgi:hypothetical protein
MIAAARLATQCERWPAPRPFFPASVPAIHATVAADPRAVRLLGLPFGIRNGLSSYGDFNASSLLFETAHHEPLLGGYLSRVSSQRVESILRDRCSGR